MNPKLLPIILCLAFCQISRGDTLFTRQGSDPTFAEVVAGGKLPQGKSSAAGVTGSKIAVNHKLVELTPEAKRPIDREILLHTLGNSAIRRKDFGKWSRWYQEDGSTQVFRLFKDEENTHNSRALAARVEAFSTLHWTKGAWHEWSGSYTIVQPHGAAIFQFKNNINDWAVQLDMNGNGDVIFNRRRGKDEVIATQMTGKPFNIRVRDNGQDYEVFLNGKSVGSGSYERPQGTTSFRWGMYVGHSKVTHDAMIFVSGATVDGKQGE